MRRSGVHVTVVFLLAAVMHAGAACKASDIRAIRTWTASSGGHRRDARLVHFDPATERVRLESSTGEAWQLGLQQLCESDRELVRRTYLLLSQAGDAPSTTARNVKRERNVVVVPASPPPAHAPTRWALLIGVDDYAILGDLQFCGNDARDMKASLIGLGFPEDQVTLLGKKDADNVPAKANIEACLDQLLGVVDDAGNRLAAGQVGADDVLVVAFSGHGLQLGDTSYFCPVDADPARPAETLVSLERIFVHLERCPAKTKLLLVDACRNVPSDVAMTPLENPPQAGASRDPSAGSIAAALQQNRKGVIALSSCLPGQVSVEESSFEHGVVMGFVLEALGGWATTDFPWATEAHREIRVTRLHEYVAARAAQYAADHPGAQVPMLRGEYAGNPILGVYRGHHRLPQFRWQGGTDHYVMDAGEIAVGNLPPGWTGSDSIAIDQKPTLRMLLATQDGPHEAATAVNIEGDFYLEFEATHLEYTTSFAVTLESEQGGTPFPIQLKSTLGLWEVAIPGTEPKQVPWQKGGLPDKFLLVRRGGVFTLIINGDASRAAVLRDNQYGDFDTLRVSLTDTKTGISRLEVGPLSSGKGGAATTVAYVQPQPKKDRLPEGWTEFTGDRRQFLRLKSPPLSIRGDFYLEFSVQHEYRALFRAMLLGRGEGCDLPIQVEDALINWHVSLPLNEEKKVAVAGKNALDDFRLERRGGVHTLSVNGQPAGVLRSEHFREYEGVCFDFYGEPEKVRVGRFRVGPLPAEPGARP